MLGVSSPSRSTTQNASPPPYHLPRSPPAHHRLPRPPPNLLHIKPKPQIPLLHHPSDITTAFPQPKTYALLLFRSFEILDAYGPLEILQFVSHFHSLNLLIFSRSFPSPVSTSPTLASMNPMNSSFYPSFVPTHPIPSTPQQWEDMKETLEGIDVLLIPGGMGVRNPDLGPELEFVRRLRDDYGLGGRDESKVLVTVCNGAAVPARAGVLRGRRVTTNKSVWGEVVTLDPEVKWVSPARWVEDGNIWTSSGVTSGLDLTLQFVRKMYPDGVEIADLIAGAIEHEPVMDWRYDPFAEKFGVPPQN
ncbi:class I glutamine amidotransferase-like protein [Sordaria brevicollis]|uniref:Class I glutamine amidotransferase-like protein n=1 Tax=Sordaria brevicollis TaxID=83679 RepID=A0AAE0PBY8_SORBR|nr:class I glutamine amidotransferase-like protein [Sordaria brevicollis]